MVYSSKLADQYAALKAEAGDDCVLLMQVGSFMQVQGEDARGVSAVTGLKLQREIRGQSEHIVILFFKAFLALSVWRPIRWDCANAG
jgi:DNA mismatch repair ATPase MutS